MKPMYLTSLKSLDYQGVLIFQVSLHVNGYFQTTTKCPDQGGVSISRVLINSFTVYAYSIVQYTKYCTANCTYISLYHS